MTIELNLANLIFILLATLSAFWALVKIIALQNQRHLDERFTTQELVRTANHNQLSKRLESIETVNREESAQGQRVERDLLRLQASMPLHYVLREDYIRGQSVIEAKLDGLGSKLENAQLRALKNVP